MNSARDPPKKTQTLISKPTLCDCLDSTSSVQRFFGGSYVLFTGLASIFFFFFTKTTLKVGSIILFTHLEIILPQCFQFSIFSNKRYPNRPYIISHFKGVEEAVTVTCVFCLGDIEIKALVIGLTFSLSLMIPKYISR